MTVPAKAFQQWLHAALPAATTAEICRGAGIKRTTLAQQLVRGRVAATSVIGISRAYGLNVVNALSSFETFSALATEQPGPTTAELISQISDMDLLRRILARHGGFVPGSGGLALEPIPHKTAVRCWIDTIGDGELRRQVSRELGIAPQNLSAQISANRLAPRAAVVAANIAGVGSANGLVVSGLLTAEEAGWPPLARETAVQSLTDSKLVQSAAERLDALGRALRKIENDNENAKALWENLG